MAQEKKFFSPILRTYGDDLSKRWRVEWYEPHPDHVHGKRMTDYGTINDGASVADRNRIASDLIVIIEQRRRKQTVLEKALEVGTINWRPKTLSAYTTVVKYFQEKVKNPDNCTTSDIHAFLLVLKKQGKTGNTIRKYRDTLFTLYGTAVKQGWVKTNPVDKTERIKRSPQSLAFFSPEQMKRIRDEAERTNPQLWLGIRLLYYCFIRPGEQRHMRISWINFEYGFIEVPGEYSKNGKTEKVSIPDHFLQEIEFLKEYNNNFYVLSKSGYPGSEQISTKWLYRNQKTVLDTLQIRGRYSFYSWKHTGAVMATKAGINIKDLQLQLRHHSLDMVNEYLKNLGVLDSPDLKKRFPVLGAAA